MHRNQGPNPHEVPGLFASAYAEGPNPFEYEIKQATHVLLIVVPKYDCTKSCIQQRSNPK